MAQHMPDESRLPARQARIHFVTELLKKFKGFC